MELLSNQPAGTLLYSIFIIFYILSKDHLVHMIQFLFCLSKYTFPLVDTGKD